MEIKKIIDEWYYDLDPAITIGERSRIILAKKITEHIEATSFTGATHGE